MNRLTNTLLQGFLALVISCSFVCSKFHEFDTQDDINEIAPGLYHGPDTMELSLDEFGYVLVSTKLQWIKDSKLDYSRVALTRGDCWRIIQYDNVTEGVYLVVGTGKITVFKVKTEELMHDTPCFLKKNYTRAVIYDDLYSPIAPGANYVGLQFGIQINYKMRCEGARSPLILAAINSNGEYMGLASFPIPDADSVTTSFFPVGALQVGLYTSCTTGRGNQGAITSGELQFDLADSLWYVSDLTGRPRCYEENCFTSWTKNVVTRATAMRYMARPRA